MRAPMENDSLDEEAFYLFAADEEKPMDTPLSEARIAQEHGSHTIEACSNYQVINILNGDIIIDFSAESPPARTVYDVKHRIQQTCGVSLFVQKLMLDDVTLDNSVELASLTPPLTLHLVKLSYVDAGHAKLMRAIRSDDIGAVRCALELPTDPNSTDRQGDTALHSAAAGGNLYLVRLLCDAACDVNSSTRRGATAIIAAAREGHSSVACYLVGQPGHDKDKHIGKKCSPLHYAAHCGSLQMVSCLCDAGYDIEMIGRADFKTDMVSYKATPLFIASYEGHCDVARYLCEIGADKDVLNSQNLSPIFGAVGWGHLETVKYLFKALADINVAYTEPMSDKPYDLRTGMTLLYLASQNGHSDIVQFLCQSGLEIDQNMSYGVSAMSVAAERGHFEVVQNLAHAKADPHKLRYLDVESNQLHNTSPLWHAAHNGHLQIVRFLFEAHGDLNNADRDGRTPLWISRDLGTLSFLCHASADVDKATKDGVTPLWMASQNGDLEIVRHLCMVRADTNKATIHNATPLYIASQMRHLEVVQHLCEARADKEKLDQYGASALHIVTHQTHGAKEVYEYLLKSGARTDHVITFERQDGKTGVYPHYRCEHNGNYEVVLCHH